MSRLPYCLAMMSSTTARQDSAEATSSNVYNATGASVLGCQTVPEDKVSSYGIVKGEPTDDARTMRVLDMVEKPAVEDAPSRMAVLGRYVITPAIFDILAHTLPGKGNEVQLTDALESPGQAPASLCLLIL